MLLLLMMMAAARWLQRVWISGSQICKIARTKKSASNQVD